MKKILSIVLVMISKNSYSIGVPIKQLQEAPISVESYKEIATQYNAQLPALWNNLTPEERVFAYYITRASIPGNRIMADQTHRHAVKMIELFQQIIDDKQKVRDVCAGSFDVESFLRDAEIFLIYLCAHHGQYFLKEFENHKRTPARLNLTTLTPENLALALDALNVSDAKNVVASLQQTMFEADYEPTLTLEGSIEKSAGNIYSPDFTQADFDALAPEIKTALNAHFYIEHNKGKRTPQAQIYKIGGKYSQELEVAHYWLERAYKHAQKYPAVFDKHIVKSLEHMLTYLKTGDEDDFKKFSLEWLKTHSRIDFNFGFVETYHDPLQYRGAFEAEVTVKVVDMKKLNALLPALEQQLPFPEEFKRQNLDDTTAIPNASINAKIFASGDAGPVKIIAAYCLPNYQEIRAEHGSKQIIYQFGKGLGEQMNPALARNLFNIREHAQWLEVHDADAKLNHDIWDVHVALHETLGHGSGRDAFHIFVEGDPLVIGGKTYALGDSLEVTSANSTEFIGGYSGALEELRAEILALYTSIFNFDALAASGLYKEWPAKIGKEKLIEWFILHMAHSGLNRLMVQADDAAEIVQAHARADTAILNYLLDHGGLELVEEVYPHNGTDYTVIGFNVPDINKAMQAVKDFAIEVQRCSSTADGQGVERLMKTYGTCIRYPEYIKILKANRFAVQGDLVEIAEIFPRLIPVVDDNKDIVDISAEWPASFIEQQLELNKLALSKE